MTKLVEIERDDEEKANAKNLRTSNLEKFSARVIPSIQVNSREVQGAGARRRSSIPVDLNHFNVHFYSGRRHSEIVLSPTDAFRSDYYKSSQGPFSKINDRFGNVFNSFTRRFLSKNEVAQGYDKGDRLFFTFPDASSKMSDDDFRPKKYRNPLEDSYDGNERILHTEFVDSDEEIGLSSARDVLSPVERPSSDIVYITNESKLASRRNSNLEAELKEIDGVDDAAIPQQRSSALGCANLSDGGDRKMSSPLPVNLRRVSDEIIRPATRPGAYNRFSSQSEDKTHNQYQDNLKTIVLSYFQLANSKWDHANVNLTKHWERRSSRVTIHPATSVLPRDSFGPGNESRMSIIADEGLGKSSPCDETDKDKYLKCNNEIEYSSGGLLNVVREDLSDNAPVVAPPESDTLLFSDGKRRIDLVLVYEEEDQGVMSEAEMMKREKRKVFKDNLEKEGLELEIEDKKGSFDEKTFFLKIHAPWQVMTRYAELMNMKMPIKILAASFFHFFVFHATQRLITLSVRSMEREKEEQDNNDKEGGYAAYFRKLFDYNHDRIPDEPSFYKATFSRNREDQFVIKDRESFFTAAQRSQIVWQILMRAKYDSTEKLGIRRLLNDETYLAAFPLHEGSYDKDTSDGFLYDRRLLYLEWASPMNWYKKQPLWLVRKYFGDKIALYFAWLGFYTYMLTLPAIVGVLCFLYGLGSLEESDNIPGNEICDESGVGNLTLCPMCDKACRYMKLGDSCIYAKMTYLFDNPATVFFAIFMSFWATMYLELWKRQQSVIVWEWDLELVEEDEEPRPEFETSVKTFRINPVTRQKEPYLPNWSKALRFLATGATVLCMIFVVLGAVLGTIIYRISLVAVIYSSGGEYLKDHAKIFTSMTAALINLIIIMILTKLYHYVAIWLTNMENPRTQSEYEDSYTFKIFLFEFVNFYSSLIYIAFFKGRFFMYPGDTDQRSSEFLKLKGDVCDPAGCLSELCIQLAIIMIGKQCLNNCLEYLYPKFWNWWYHRIHHNNTKKDFKRKLTRWEEDYQMQDAGRLALFEEYLEMVLQYGFVTLFVAAFPLAPLFAFLNNIGEIRLDAFKMVTQSRRPLAERVQNIGAWYGILKGLTYAAVVSNAFVIGYTSDFIPRMVYKFVYSPTHDLRGYIRSSLSEFNTSDYREDMGSADDDPDPPICYYRGYRNPPDHPTDPYDLSPQYWHIFAARLAFVVVFEHFVFALTGIMAYIIPDIPASVKTQMQRERVMAKEAKYEKGLKSGDGGEELLGAVRDQNLSRLEAILRRGSWGRRFSRHSDDVESHINVSIQGKKESCSRQSRVS